MFSLHRILPVQYYEAFSIDPDINSFPSEQVDESPCNNYDWIWEEPSNPALEKQKEQQEEPWTCDSQWLDQFDESYYGTQQSETGNQAGSEVDEHPFFYEETVTYEQPPVYEESENYEQPPAYKESENYEQPPAYEESENYEQPPAYDETGTYEQPPAYEESANFEQPPQATSKVDYLPVTYTYDYSPYNSQAVMPYTADQQGAVDIYNTDQCIHTYNVVNTVEEVRIEPI